jgi:hypothetical protein
MRSPLFIRQAAILRRADDKPMIQILATDQHLVNVRATITHADPLNILSVRSFAHALARRLPPRRLAGAPLPGLGIIFLFSLWTGLSDVVVLVGQSQDFHRRASCPLMVGPGFHAPPHSQRRMQMESLQPLRAKVRVKVSLEATARAQNNCTAPIRL